MLCIALVSVLTVAVIGSAVTFAQNDRKLPIYCVETDKKQVAISFDAAWGNTKKVQNHANPHNHWFIPIPFWLIFKKQGEVLTSP